MTKEIYLAGGCFWGTEKYLAEIPGVLQTEVGYANGYTKNPTYEEVCSGETGYAETVRVVYDSNMIRLSYLLTLFFQSINPLSKNRQGNDVGEQYRSGIYYIDTNDEPVIREVMEGLQKRVDGVVQIEVAPLTSYFTAEQYHQKYLYRNPGGYCHIPSGLLQKASQMRDPESKYYPQEQDKLKKTLTKQQYEVAFQSATESPFANEYHDHWEQGIYVDITTGEPLFRSEDKFDAGCGWPSFSKPMDFGRVMNILDESHGMKRVEVRSKNGDIHLGHVFDDGPEDSGGLRYCMNSSSLRFIPKSRMRQEGYGDYE